MKPTEDDIGHYEAMMDFWEEQALIHGATHIERGHLTPKGRSECTFTVFNILEAARSFEKLLSSSKQVNDVTLLKYTVEYRKPAVRFTLVPRC